MVEYNFPVCGVEPDRLWAVGSCKVCSLPLTHFEEDGPPVGKDTCEFHNKRFVTKKPTPIRRKTQGHMLLDLVCGRNKDNRGAGSIKMTDDARADLISEIDKAIGGAK